MPKRKGKSGGGRELEELMEQASQIKRTSQDLIRRMKELASQISEAKARAADDAAKRKRPAGN